MAASWMEEYKKNASKTAEKSTGLRKSISGTSYKDCVNVHYTHLYILLHI